MKRAIIIGASTGIGAEMARQLAGRKYQVFLVARSGGKIEALATELCEKYGPLAAESLVHDVLNFGEVPELFDRMVGKLGALDLLVYNSGVMHDVALDEYDTAKDLQVIDVNLRGAIGWLNAGARYFSGKRSGTIAVVSSVAGDRGRAKVPAYHAAKAGLSTFAESLWVRLSKKGVRVVTVKPGPIDTPMTEGKMDPKKLYPVEQAVSEMIQGIEAGKRVVYVPKKWFLIMFIVRNIPPFIFKRLSF